jgi:hypothetical protein
MGTWGTAISSNDTYADIYEAFFDLYNDGYKVVEISNKLITDNQETINNNDDSTNFWFALAKAQWECKQLDKDIFNRVKQIIESGSDISIWRNLDASEKELKKRKVVLDKFLTDLQKVKPKAKSRKIKIMRQPVFEIGDCLTFKLENGNYGGAIVLSSELNTCEGFNLVALTRINQKIKPKYNDFINSEILYMNNRQVLGGHFFGLFPAKGFKKKYNELFEIIDRITISKRFDIDDDNVLPVTYCYDWTEIIHSSNIQFKYEELNQKGNETIHLSEII